MSDHSIELYPHNREAYDKLCILLEKYRKACVIHPTGTGKSFIAFKYLEDNPHKKVLWVSPSDTIFYVQIKNLYKATDTVIAAGIEGRIKYMTYPALLKVKNFNRMEKRDVIVLDEFHRCGAPKWGKAIEKLMAANKDAVIIGLTATHIRYLDNHRNMAEEIFGGLIASYMTIDKAIERQILKAPKYIVAWSEEEQRTLEFLERNVGSIRDIQKENYIRKNICTINNDICRASGMKNIFKKYLEPGGKYIVFLSRHRQMSNVAEKIKGWCSGVDAIPKIYRVGYRDNAWRKVEEFSKDDSDHIKFLLCIDILNEGVHIENVNGIIMMRLTRSPTRYFQQIGRTLCVGGKKDPIVIDIANNFQSTLSSIDTQPRGVLHGRFKKGRYVYPANTGDPYVFEVIDTVKNSRELLGKLKDIINDTWEAYYLEAVKYYESFGNLDIKESYVTESGLSLGKWMQAQRRIRCGVISGELSAERIRLLDNIDMKWEMISRPYTLGSRVICDFDTALSHLRNYKAMYGDLMVPYRYMSGDFPLGKWVSEARAKYGNRYANTAERLEQKMRLDGIGFIWNCFDYAWDKYYGWCHECYKKYGAVDTSKCKFTYSGYGNIYTWINSIKMQYNRNLLSLDKIAKLAEIGILIDDIDIHTEWRVGYNKAKAFFDKYGTLNLKKCFVRDDTFDLYKWVVKQQHNKLKLSKEQIRMLDEIGMEWHESIRGMGNHGEKTLAALKNYYEEHGNIDIPQSYETESGIMLGMWLHHQKQIREKLSDRRVALLESYGIDWDI